MNDRWLIRSVSGGGAARPTFLIVATLGLVAVGAVLVLGDGDDGNLAIQSVGSGGSGQLVRTDGTDTTAPGSTTTAVLAVAESPGSGEPGDGSPPAMAPADPAMATPADGTGTAGRSAGRAGPNTSARAPTGSGATAGSASTVGSSDADGEATSTASSATTVASTAEQASTAPPTSPSTPLPSSTGAGHPSERVDMASWKITLPISKDDYFGSGGSTAAELKPGRNEGVSVPGVWEVVDHPVDGSMARFRVTTGGARTSSGTKYARTELRQLVDGDDGYWSFSGQHTLTVRGRVMETPPNRPEVVVAQIKAGSDEAARVEWDGDQGWNLVWDEDNTEQLGRLGYDIGEAFLVELVVDDYEVSAKVTNLDSGQSAGKQWRTELSKARSTGGYFKAGAYVQSQAGVDDSPDAVADVWFSQISL